MAARSLFASTTSLVLTASTTAALLTLLHRTYRHHTRTQDHRRRRLARAKLVDEEKEKDLEQETLPSILEHFRELRLAYGCSVSDANQRRTTKYYELARTAHLYDLCLGVRSYPRLRNRRDAELARIFKYQRSKEPRKSHRTVVVMTDRGTAQLLAQARDDILAPLRYTTDIRTTGCWIPSASLLPPKDMHVTVAIPWWWHTVQPGNKALSDELVARFKQALILEFHHSFQLELERIVLLGGKTLVALWRCVGERITEDGDVIYDRHGEGPDPFVKLRRDIVRCFTGTADELKTKEPLTYAHRFPTRAAPPPKDPFPGHANETTKSAAATDTAASRQAHFASTRDHESTPTTQLPPVQPIPPPPPARTKVQRENTIELKTPGLGDHDGFIHTTLARLPLDCLSMKDVELDTIHRLCREATAQYCGHRLVVRTFRFLETIGAGGESNPCVRPMLDETIEAPPRVQVDGVGGIAETTTFSKTVQHHATIGAPPTVDDRTTVSDLFAVEQHQGRKSVSGEV